MLLLYSYPNVRQNISSYTDVSLNNLHCRYNTKNTWDNAWLHTLYIDILCACFVTFTLNDVTVHRGPIIYYWLIVYSWKVHFLNIVRLILAMGICIWILDNTPIEQKMISTLNSQTKDGSMLPNGREEIKMFQSLWFYFENCDRHLTFLNIFIWTFYQAKRLFLCRHFNGLWTLEHLIRSVVYHIYTTKIIDSICLKLS